MVRRILQKLLWAMPMILFLVSPLIAGTLIMHAIAVGHGDAIFFELPDGRKILVDAGTKDAGKRIVEYLQSLGVASIDVVVVTHPHEDHIGGMKAVLDAFEVGKIWDSGFVQGSKLQREFLSTVRDRSIRIGHPKGGFGERFGRTMIDVLAPVVALEKANNNSIILRISYGNFSALLMGDAEEEERESVGTFPESTVLKIAHHGNRNGTDAILLSQVRPQAAVISCGERDSVGHPHERTVRLLEKAGVKWFSTTSGDVIVATNGVSFDISYKSHSGRAATSLFTPEK